MPRTPVSSSNLASVGYDPLTATLEVEFNSGPVYLFEGVPASVFEELVSAQSPGGVFNAQVRGAFDFEIAG